MPTLASLSPWCLATLGESLPEGTYKLASGEPGKSALGWLLAQHRFDAYRSKPEPDRGPRVLVTGEAASIDQTVRLAEATALVRDLVDTPAADLGPAELEQAVRDEAAGRARTSGSPAATSLPKEYPLIAAVGAAATPERAPRLIELEWGKPGDPRIAIVGKGVCFDSGGLDLKPAAGMRIMKKDMGGAAHALALARLIAAERLPVRLHLLIAAVENAVSGSAYRPGDIVKSRKGLFVEVDNTDAEGRLVLADALDSGGRGQARADRRFRDADRRRPRCARPRPPGVVRQPRRSSRCRSSSSARDVEDPVWRMPLWDAYDENLKSNVADLANMANNPMAGCIYAALFLRRFVPEEIPWAHLDTWAWRDPGKPGRPKGGDALGLRATFAMIEDRYPRR